MVTHHFITSLYIHPSSFPHHLHHFGVSTIHVVLQYINPHSYSSITHSKSAPQQDLSINSSLVPLLSEAKVSSSFYIMPHPCRSHSGRPISTPPSYSVTSAHLLGISNTSIPTRPYTQPIHVATNSSLQYFYLLYSVIALAGLIITCIISFLLSHIFISVEPFFIYFCIAYPITLLSFESSTILYVYCIY